MQPIQGRVPSPTQRDSSQGACLEECAPRPLEAVGAREKIIAHLPGEGRDSLLALAEAHGVTRSDRGAGPVPLEQRGRVKLPTDGRVSSGENSGMSY